MTDQLHQRIRRARERARLSQADVARAIGVSVRTIVNWESGSSVPRNRMGALEELLNERFTSEGPVSTAPKDPDPHLPVGSGVDPIDLAELSAEDREYLRGLYERLRARRGE